MDTISLAGRWQVTWTDGDHGAAAHYLEPVSDPGRYLTMEFPGSIQSGLMKAGLVDDPREGLNFLKARWVEEKMWILRREFNVPAEAVDQPAFLHIRVLDGAAKVAINGTPVGAHENAFYPAVFSLHGLLRAGTNEVSILLESGLFKVADESFGDYSNKLEVQLNKRMHLRQAQYQFGWDWNPRLVFFGMHQDIEIRWGEQPWLKQVTVLAEVSADLKSARIRVKPLVVLGGSRSLPVHIEASSGGDMRCMKTTYMAPGENETELVLEVEHPALWWPRGYGEQPLYPLEVKVSVNGQQAAQWTGRTGLRRVEIDQPPHPEEGRYFHLKINNQVIFCKGANWIPPELSGHEVAPERIRALVERAEQENMNTLRLWGGGVWANHTLLDLADEKGFIVWHDLLFACAKYPGDQPEFLANAEREVAWGIREFSPHPSLAVWCGNNENEAGLWEWQYKQFGKTAPDMVLYHHAFPILMARLDPTRPYWPSSPYSSVTETPSTPTTGDQHPWGVSLSWDDIFFWAYRRYNDRFPNEGGVLGCAPVASLRRFLSEKELAMRSFAWEHHDNTICFWKVDRAFPYRQVEYYLGAPVEGMDVERYALASGLMQAEGLKEYILNYRRRMPSTSSAIYWMFNDSWPTVHGWTAMDYYLNRKLAFYPVKRAFADMVIILADEGGEIGAWVVNDTGGDFNGTVALGSFVPGGDIDTGETLQVTVPARTSLRVARLPRDEDRVTFAVLRGAKGEAVSQDRILLKPWSEFSLAAPQIAVRTFERGGKRFASYWSPEWVWGVILDPSGEEDVADDVFDLLPGVEYEVELKSGQEAPPVKATGNGLVG